MAIALADRYSTPPLDAAGVPQASTTRRDFASAVIVCAPLVCTTMLSKLSFPPLGARGLGLEFPVIFLMLAFGFVTGRLQFAPKRLLLFLGMFSVLGMLQLLHGEVFSLSSVVLMAALGGAVVFRVRDGEFDSEQIQRFFQNLTALLAVLGIAQFLLQFVLGPVFVFPIESFVPEGFRTLTFNNIAPLFWGSPIFRSNGVVMLEPSFFSQLCALGLVCELCRQARALRLAAYVVGMLVSYSGTGVLVLAVALPLLVVLNRRWDLLCRGLVLAALVAVLAEPLNLTLLFNRANEFDAQGSSGFQRFVAWQSLFADRLWPSIDHALFGYGAGSFVDASVGYRAAEMAHTKIIFEFGVLGALVYFSFVLYCIFSAKVPIVLRVALAVCYFMNGAYTANTTCLALSLLMWPAPPAEGRASAPGAGILGRQYAGTNA